MENDSLSLTRASEEQSPGRDTADAARQDGEQPPDDGDIQVHRAAEPAPGRAIRGDQTPADAALARSALPGQVVIPDEPANLSPQIQGMAHAGSTNREIAEFLEISETFLKTQYGAQLKKWRAERKVRLRARQTTLANEGNATMLSHLGKHELGQSGRRADPADSFAEPELDEKVG
jgi:hypothetical protein